MCMLGKILGKLCIFFPLFWKRIVFVVIGIRTYGLVCEVSTLPVSDIASIFTF